MIKTRKISLAGSGWGAVAAYKSLCRIFPVLEVITKDQYLIKELRECDILLSDIKLGVAEVIICAGYKEVISREILKTKEIINVHYSLLPKYRGLHSTVWAILNEESELGLTIHRMNEKIDDGDIIYQFTTKNDGESTATFYMNMFNDWIDTNLGNIIISYFSGNIKAIKQDFSRATWVGKRSIEDCEIDFRKDHLYLKTFFRVLNPPYPKPFFRIKAKAKCYFPSKIVFLERKINTQIGRILNIDDKGLYISSKDGYVILSEITDLDGQEIANSKFMIGEYLEKKNGD
ncbi:methionyl-tRNA formyltransferase [Kaistella polysaccharea]|uniref:methionyl-tRNA formyltransferase n=1 Tax=Kaistella polysaccharea TaxID=2878534 RepID=UPI001CF19225|nr:formyltransferase family protein [Kaistella polysaccharea]